ncbi:GH25 family lysozyme [Bacillus sp. S13(2024)]|uniref:GH25 family lysozyme n=1 Tax=Bacillus sp. S13(2024) TaxID=3162885 RepID=UPI003D263727
MKNIVDISKYNDSINWDVAAPQLDLAICRVQYGSNKVDQLYKQHVTKLESYGIPHGAYAYGCFTSVADAIAEAEDFMSRVSPNAKFLVLDVEDDTLASCGATNLAKASQAFIDRCKAKGWKVGFYVSHHMIDNGDPYGLLGVTADFRWIPRYGAKPKFPCEIWQYADNTTGGYVAGIGNCDVNRLNGDKSLEWFIGTNTISASSIQAQPQGIGIATSKYPEGYGINTYSEPVNGEYTGTITKPIPYLVLAGHWLGGDNNMLCLGNRQWVKQEHFKVQWFYAYSKFPEGYGINTYYAPNGNYTGSISSTVGYAIWARQDGWLCLGNNSWVKEEHFNIK